MVPKLLWSRLHLHLNHSDETISPMSRLCPAIFTSSIDFKLRHYRAALVRRGLISYWYTYVG